MTIVRKDRRRTVTARKSHLLRPGLPTIVLKTRTHTHTPIHKRTGPAKSCASSTRVKIPCLFDYQIGKPDKLFTFGFRWMNIYMYTRGHSRKKEKNVRYTRILIEKRKKYSEKNHRILLTTPWTDGDERTATIRHYISVGNQLDTG